MSIGDKELGLDSPTMGESVQVSDLIKNIDEIIQISLLSEYYYCKRRCSLILLEGRSTNNQYMVEGEIGHSKVHTSKIEKRSGLVKIYNLQVFSLKYPIIGRTDCIECIQDKSGTYIDILGDKYQITPIEYKRGTVRNEEEYNIQLCAQAMCLEEMYNTTIERGYIYYIDSNERFEVLFTDNLRAKVIAGVVAIFDIINKKKVFTPEYKKRCLKCSLFEKCNPKKENIKQYLESMWGELI